MVQRQRLIYNNQLSHHTQLSHRTYCQEHLQLQSHNQQQHLQLQLREMPVALGPTPELNVNPFERCNLWELYSTLACGIAKLRFITLWDGSSGSDGPGGTAHLLRQVQRRTGRVEWIDTRTLKPDVSPDPGG